MSKTHRIGEKYSPPKTADAMTVETVVRNLLAMPHEPHVKKKTKRKKRTK